jgi:polygalacturonase
MSSETKISEFGGVADGKHKNTQAFARAIEACVAGGGGRVIVPPGTWLTGPIELKSNLELHLENGATVLFGRDYDDFPLTVTDYEGEQAVRCTSPIWGSDLVNVAITGDGTFDGQGEAWRPVKKKKVSEQEWKKLVASGGAVDDAAAIWYPTRQAMEGIAIADQLRRRGLPLRASDYAPARDALRPNMVKLTRCRNLTLDGPTFKNSAAWNVHLLLCENVSIRNVTVQNEWNAQNGDALDMDSCRNVTVTDSLFDAGDDAICIKSGKDEAGRRRGIPCENITITNCTVLRGHGGVTIGSEMSGGVRNVSVRNCLFRGTDIGLRFKTTRGRGGVVENIDIANVVMHDIRYDAISINMYYWIAGEPVPEPVSERTPAFRDFSIRNVVCHGASRALEIRGLPEMPVERITLENVRIQANRGAMLDDAKDITLSGVRLEVREGPAMQCRNVTGLRTDRLDTTAPAERITERVGDL